MTVRLRFAIIVILLVLRPASAAERVVYLAGKLSDEELIVLGAAASASESTPLLLLDTPATANHLKSFLTAYQPDRVVPIGEFPDSVAERETRLGVPLAPAA